MTGEGHCDLLGRVGSLREAPGARSGDVSPRAAVQQVMRTAETRVREQGSPGSTAGARTIANSRRTGVSVAGRDAATLKGTEGG